jgi:hypothetical protein
MSHLPVPAVECIGARVHALHGLLVVDDVVEELENELVIMAGTRRRGLHTVAGTLDPRTIERAKFGEGTRKHSLDAVVQEVPINVDRWSCGRHRRKNACFANKMLGS